MKIKFRNKNNKIIDIDLVNNKIMYKMDINSIIITEIKDYKEIVNLDEVRKDLKINLQLEVNNQKLQKIVLKFFLERNKPTVRTYKMLLQYIYFQYVQNRLNF